MKKSTKMKKVQNFKLTPEWVLNNLPQSYLIIEDELGIVTGTELDFVLIKQALQTLGIEYEEGEYKNDGDLLYGVMFQVDDVSQVLHQKLKELKTNNENIRRSFVRPPETGKVLSALFFLSISLGPKVSKLNNESHHIDVILSYLSELLVSKCKFLLDSDGRLCYNFKDQDEQSLESDESGLLIMIGVFACYKINLEYLELKNPKWKGLNKTLSEAFPEIYDVYISLSKKFDFKGTARLWTAQNISEKRIQKYLQNPVVDFWDSDLLELDENYFEEEGVKQSTGNVNEGNGFLPPIQKQKSLNSKSESNSFSVN
jgi:hypothetical protein